MKQENNLNQNISGESSPGDKKMETAYKLASSLVRDRLKQEDDENIKILDDMKNDDVLVVEGYTSSSQAFWYSIYTNIYL